MIRNIHISRTDYRQPGFTRFPAYHPLSSSTNISWGVLYKVKQRSVTLMTRDQYRAMEGKNSYLAGDLAVPSLYPQVTDNKDSVLCALQGHNARKPLENLTGVQDNGHRAGLQFRASQLDASTAADGA